jgi:hypothetical protein
VGSRGRLTGTLRRFYRGDRSTMFTSGTPVMTPRSEVDFWNGSLVFGWEL